MRRMTGPSAGADYEVLRTYYIHAVRSLIDYSSIALVGLSPAQIHDIQVQQNKTLWLIVGAPIWTKISNLQMETNIPPVEVRVTKKHRGSDNKTSHTARLRHYKNETKNPTRPR